MMNDDSLKPENIFISVFAIVFGAFGAG